MGQMSTSMLCLVLLSLVVLAQSFPFASRGKPPDFTVLTNNGAVKVQTEDKKGHTFQTMTSVNDLHSVDDLTPENIPVLDSIDTGLDTSVATLDKGMVASDSFTDLGQKKATQFEKQASDKHGVNETRIMSNGNNRKPFNGDQFHLSKFNSLLDSYLRGFQPETIDVPEHRKSRHRRSILLEYGITDDEDVVFSPHTSPCGHADRHYCLNGGTCVFVVALEIKTCRCKIGYTGLRCERINQEFLLALLADDFFG